MCIICFIHKDKLKYLNKNDNISNYKACGLGNYLGNKGAVHISFNYQERVFSFIGCHLLHGQDNRLKRDEMMEDITKYLKTKRDEMDADIHSDYAFIMGDLNYRFESTFDEMISNPKFINNAHNLIDSLDQLTISRRGLSEEFSSKKYPGYFECKIEFKPTYKRESHENIYKNKKN